MQYKWVWRLYDHYLVDHLLLLWVVLPERNNFPPKNFILPESETETCREHRSIPTAYSAAMMHSRPNCAKSVSLWGSCSPWLFSGVPNGVKQLLSLFFFDLKRTTDQSMESKQREGNKRTRVFSFSGTFGPKSEFQQGLICDFEWFGSPRLFPVGTKKAQPLHNCPQCS